MFPGSASAPRDRFVAFAFAGADLLVEASPDGTIAFASGAFRARLGLPPEYFLGRRVTDLVAPGDQVQLGLVLSTAAVRGRIAPMVLRLNDATRTQASVSALHVPGDPPRLCITLGPVPQELGFDAPPGPRQFAREVEARLRLVGGAELSLLEVTNWNAAREEIPLVEQAALLADIRAALAEASSGGLAGELGNGRFGVVGERVDQGAVRSRVTELLRAAPGARVARVEGTVLPLGRMPISPARAARTLRYALSQFADGGTVALRELGSEAGLVALLDQAERRARLLRGMISERRFRLSFQPVVNLFDQTVHHYEALLRPIACEGVPTGTTQDFIVFVEAVGLSAELDQAVTQSVLTALAAAPRASVAVNLSGLSVENGSFVERFLDLVGRTGLASRLLVELTETAEIDNIAHASSNLARIRDAGMAVCLDDFGAGAATLSYLREFRVDFVKIDGLYVQRAGVGPRELGFVASMVEMAATSGAEVIAEMVETEEQAALMRRLGARYGQGWLFGRPGALPGSMR